MQTARTGSVALRAKSGAWKSGKHKTLSTFPHPRLRRRLTELNDNCVKLTSLPAQNIGQATTDSDRQGNA
jgi:hypothetical protein